MPRDSTATREKILDAALALVFDRGFGATAIDAVIERAGITKGTFFYHFKNKNDLARALVERFARQDMELLEEFSARAEKLSRDPLQQLLIFLGLFHEMFEDLDEVYPGCLFASFCYQSGLMGEDINALGFESVMKWRAWFTDKFRAIERTYPPRIDVDYDDLADLFTGILEGAFILSRMTDDPKLIARHMKQYRDYVELIFAPPQ